MNYEATLSSGDLLSDEEAGAKRKKRLMIGLGVLLLMIVAAGVAYFFATGGSGQGAAAGDEANAQAPTVTVIAPGSNTVARSISATGTLAARREVPVGVVGEGGRVTIVHADAGDWVKKGQTLVTIDRSVQTQQAEALRAQIGVSEADLRLAQNELDRALKLVDRGFISKADVDRRTATRDSARARLNVARAQYQQALASNARLNVLAPVSGYVLERNVEVGQTASAGSGALFRIAQGGEMEMRARVGETDLAQISTGVVAEVTPVGSEKAFSGQVWQVSPVIDPQNRQGTARISLSYATELRPGGFASARINSGAVTASVLPESAILSDDDGSFVYIVGKDNKAQQRRVKTGIVTDGGVAIIEGLNGNERVVLRAGGFLTEGETISPKMQSEE